MSQSAGRVMEGSSTSAGFSLLHRGVLSKGSFNVHLLTLLVFSFPLSLR